METPLEQIFEHLLGYAWAFSKKEREHELKIARNLYEKSGIDIDTICSKIEEMFIEREKYSSVAAKSMSDLIRYKDSV